MTAAGKLSIEVSVDMTLFRIHLGCVQGLLAARTEREARIESRAIEALAESRAKWDALRKELGLKVPNRTEIGLTVEVNYR